MSKKEENFFIVLVSVLGFIFLCEMGWLVSVWLTSKPCKTSEPIPVVIVEPGATEEVKKPEVDIYDLCLTATKSKYIDLIANEVLINAQKYKHPVWFVYAVMESESLNGITKEVNHKASNSYGAIGLFQNTLGGSLGDWNRMHPDCQYTLDDMYNIKINIEVGCWYLAFIRDQYLKDWQLTYGDLYIAYNVGAAAFKKYRVDYYNGWDPIHNCSYNAYKRWEEFAIKQYNHFNGIE